MSINQVLFCFRTHNNLYMPEMVARLGDSFAKALDMLDVEKNAILGKRFVSLQEEWQILRDTWVSDLSSEIGLRTSFFIVFAAQLWFEPAETKM